MKQTSFSCDNCEKIITTNLDKKSVKHFRILRAEIRKDQMDFLPIINQNNNGDGLHFCSVKCLNSYFNEFWKEY